MRLSDRLQFNWQVARGHKFRTAMLMLSLVIGVTAVNLLTGLGEGARLFVMGEFSSLGKNTLIVLPGKTETSGGMPPMTGESPRELTLRDAQAIARLPGVVRAAPLVVGMAELSHGGRLRESFVLGSSAEFFAIRQLALRQGRALPQQDWDLAYSVCVIGTKLKQELFGAGSALGQWIRADQRRFRVIGVLHSKGVAMGNNLDEAMLIPVASAQLLFDQEGLFRVFAEVRSERQLAQVKQAIIQVVTQLHDGVEDITLITQDAVLSAFNRILAILTGAVAGIAAISLAVAGVLIMNIMLISVSQRTAEIGLLKALGADASTVRSLFLGEALMLAMLGALLGVLLSEALLAMGRFYYSTLPLYTPLWATMASVTIALGTAAAFAWLPAVRASKLEAVDALSAGQGV